MHSFTLNAVGNLARNPELVVKNDTTFARFCLLGNDYSGRDEAGGMRDMTTSLWFVAFGTLGEVLARTARRGDQLFVQARVRASNWTDRRGEQQYDHSFIVSGFRFGAQGKARREEAQRAEAPATSAAQAVGE
jgi:single-strand DNA-binding protein